MTLTIIRGLPGSGKSTLAKSIGIPFFEADMYFRTVFNPSKLKGVGYDAPHRPRNPVRDNRTSLQMASRINVMAMAMYGAMKNSRS